jgi:hypothetical protein
MQFCVCIWKRKSIKAKAPAAVRFCGTSPWQTQIICILSGPVNSGVGRYVNRKEDDNFADCIFCAPLILIQLISKMVVVMHKIINVKALDNYKVELEYDNGRQGIADLSHLAGKGVFSLWNDYDAFRNVKIGSSGELVWSDQVDLCPDSLYLKITNQKPEDLFPSLKQKAAYA